jgi:hypothetical protein
MDLTGLHNHMDLEIVKRQTNEVTHLILQSLDWLATFHLELLQAILFIAV